MNWNKVWIVARHAFLVNVRRTAFIVMTLLVPVLGLVGLLAAVFLSGQMEQVGAFFDEQFDIGSDVIGVVDRSGYFSPILPEYQDTFVLYESQEQAEADLLADTLATVIVIDADYLETGQVVVVETGSGFGSAVIGDSAQARAFFVDHLLSGAVDDDLRQRAANPASIEPRVISSSGETQGEGGWGFAFTFVVPYLLSIFLVMTIFISSGYLLQSVAEEKESRMIEIVISSVRPVELMAGKVLGLGALGLLQILVWVGSSVALSGGATAILAVAGAASIPPRVLILGVVYYVLGYLVYAVLMAGVGALGTNIQESQKIAGIFSLFASIPYMLSGFLFANPNMGIARVLSYFPLTAPTMMLLRIPIAEVPVVDVIVSIVALLIFIPLALWAGAKLFRVGILIYDKRPTLKDVWRILWSRENG